MDKNESLVNCLSEHIDSNAECMDRLMIIISDNFPMIQSEIYELRREWRRVNAEINEEFKGEEK